MGDDWVKRGLGAGPNPKWFRSILIAGLFSGLSGCGEGSADIPDPEEFLPKAPMQNQLICDWTVSWRLPTERENGEFLAPGEIATVTVYAARRPLAPADDLEFIMDVDPLLLQWQFAALEPGDWYFRLTATDNDGLESTMSNERNNEECP